MSDKIGEYTTLAAVLGVMTTATMGVLKLLFKLVKFLVDWVKEKDKTISELASELSGLQNTLGTLEERAKEYHQNKDSLSRAEKKIIAQNVEIRAVKAHNAVLLLQLTEREKNEYETKKQD